MHPSRPSYTISKTTEGLNAITWSQRVKMAKVKTEGFAVNH